MSGLTHAELVKRALEWSRGILGAQLAITEVGSGQVGNGEFETYSPGTQYERTFEKTSDEQPDVWCLQLFKQFKRMPFGTLTVNIECKASRSDFLADRKKMTRIKPEQGSGQVRWFYTNPGVCSTDELPDGWGLAVVNGSRHRYLRSPKIIEQDHRGRMRDFNVMKKIALEYRNYATALKAQILHNTDLEPVTQVWSMNGRREVKV